MRAIALLTLLAMAGCMPKNETVITDTTAKESHMPAAPKFWKWRSLASQKRNVGEWTMPSRVVIVPPPYCEREYQRFVLSAMNPRVAAERLTWSSRYQVIYCYRKGYEAL